VPYSAVGITRSEFLAAFAQAGVTGKLDMPLIPPDLSVPALINGPPRAGARVRVGGKLYHALYLPADWRRGNKYPVIIEYPGNGPGPLEKTSDLVTGTPEACSLGYGVSAGKRFIWVSLPFVQPDESGISRQWWGSADATVAYCFRTVRDICRNFGGDPNRVLLCGFSRGSIACNYIGLRNDEIAGLWRAFFCHSHYDGVRRWPYADSGGDFALARLRRLKGRPQFISHELSVDPAKAYLNSTGVTGDFTFKPIPYAKHTDKWVLYPVPVRATLRAWVDRVMG
jgi:hypothetical protein